jgi:hypothetical protein
VGGEQSSAGPDRRESFLSLGVYDRNGPSVPMQGNLAIDRSCGHLGSIDPDEFTVVRFVPGLFDTPVDVSEAD